MFFIKFSSGAIDFGVRAHHSGPMPDTPGCSHPLFVQRALSRSYSSETLERAADRPLRMFGR